MSPGGRDERPPGPGPLSLLVGQHREPACEEVLGTSRSLEEEDADDHQGGNQWLRPGRARVHAHRAGPLANLLAFDSTFGRLGHTVDYTDRSLTVGGASIAVLSERDPAGIDWHALGADVVIEATGKFRTRDSAALHQHRGLDAVRGAPHRVAVQPPRPQQPAQPRGPGYALCPS